MLQLLVVGFTVAANFFLAAMVLKKNHRSATNVMIALLALLFSSWTIANHMALSPGPEEVRLFWVRLVMVITSPLGVFLWLLATVFPGKKYTVGLVTTLFILLLVVITAVLSMSPFVFIELTNLADGNFTLIPGPGIIVFGSVFLGFSMMAIITFMRKMRAASGLQRKQFKIVIVGILLSMFLLTLTNFLAVILFQSITLTFLGPPFTLIMVGSMTYAVIKHKFLDIRTAIARSISFSLLIAVIALFYSLLIFVMTRILLEEAVSAQTTAISAIIALPLLLTFDRLKSFIQKTTEHLFFKYDYDLERVMEELSQIMSSTLKLRLLLQKVISILQARLKVSDVKIGIQDEGGYLLFSNKEVRTSKETAAELKKLNSYAKQSDDGILVFEELEEGPLKQKMRGMNVEVIVSLVTENKLIGSLFLSAKSNGEVYSPQDVQLIKILAPQLSIAIQNAESYEEIRKFNITLEKEVDEATKELKRANIKLQELDKLKDEFVSIASHELRTPLTAIKSYLWMAMAGKGGKLNEKQLHYISRSYNSTERLIKLVNDMLNVSRIEAGRVSLAVSSFNIVELIGEVIEEVRPRADELFLKVSMANDPAEAKSDACLVVGDQDKVREVLLNLVGNSLKFTPKNGQITLKADCSGSEASVSVTDTGRGIEPANIDNLFQKFGLMEGSYQTNQQASQGTGLGLYICKRIIELHGGKIWAESEGREKGATFNFTLQKYTPEKLELFQEKFKDAQDIGIIQRGI